MGTLPPVPVRARGARAAKLFRCLSFLALAAVLQAREPTGAEAPLERDPPAGIFHRVEPGQTVWRLARAYGVTIEAMAEANRVFDPRSLEVGRMLFIPGATAKLEVRPHPAALPPAPGPGPGMAALLGFIWPVSEGEILAYFGEPRRDHHHAGLDIRAGHGQEVLAVGAGRVTYSGSTLGGYGKMVILDHGEGLQSLYAHNSDLLVEMGDRVERGQPVARAGRTGNASTEHCHFEIRKDKLPVDPLPYLPGRQEMVRRATTRADSAVETP